MSAAEADPVNAAIAVRASTISSFSIPQSVCVSDRSRVRVHRFPKTSVRTIPVPPKMLLREEHTSRKRPPGNAERQGNLRQAAKNGRK